MARKWVYSFTEIEDAEAYAGDWEGVRGLLGGKGANLADMARIGVPVPPGFTVTTEACIAYLDREEIFSTEIWEEEREALRRMEAEAGKRFGDPSSPLLVSCRSGARFSMPGMMDTILNLGMNDEVARGMVELTGDARFVYDAYRRLVQMFGTVVRGMRDEVFDEVIEKQRRAKGARTDADLEGDDWREITARFKDLTRRYTGSDFPEDPDEQLELATEAVFKSWTGRRATDYRNASGISHDLGTAVNIQTMVFGNMGDECATGVAMSRNPSTGERSLEGDFLVNAQGEDVVAGIRKTLPIAEMAQRMPGAYRELEEISNRLEAHYRDMQDMEFTVERGELWLLQTRDAKRTAQAAVRIAVEMAGEGLLSNEEAVLRVTPEQVEFFLHPQLEESARREARLVGHGLNVSPGAGVGVVALDAETAERWGKGEGKPVIMMRPETKPDDIHGMLASQGIVTSRGGRTSHAALVARQFGKPAVVGVDDLEIDPDAREARMGDLVIQEGDWISIDGLRGDIYLGKLPTVVPDIQDRWLTRLLEWADGFRKLDVRANADHPRDAQRAREYGAQGIGLCRTEHMFFEEDRLPMMREMIMASTRTEREEALGRLLPLQRGDFDDLLRVMDGLPVVIRLLDPPLHEFLPDHEELFRELVDLKMKLQHLASFESMDQALAEIRVKQDFLARVEALREGNPMLGTRGVRLGILFPELTRMQVRAIFEAASACSAEGVDVQVEIMIPLVGHVNELEAQQEELEGEARAVMAEREAEVAYRFGTMIEVPRAALTADEIAGSAGFFSFGTNDLTQMVFAISRDDAEAGFLMQYVEKKILPDNPFATLDTEGVGRLMTQAVELGRKARPGLEIGICGEHGGDPRSIAFCHRIGLDYVSCSPYRVPIARLAAARAALRESSTSPAGRGGGVPVA